MTLLAAAVAVLALTALGLAIWFVPTYRRHCDKLPVVCPETKEPALVQVNAARYTLTSLLDRPHLRLKDCSRWPERAGCDRACEEQLRR